MFARDQAVDDLDLAARFAGNAADIRAAHIAKPRCFERIMRFILRFLYDVKAGHLWRSSCE